MFCNFLTITSWQASLCILHSTSLILAPNLHFLTDTSVHRYLQTCWPSAVTHHPVPQSKCPMPAVNLLSLCHLIVISAQIQLWVCPVGMDKGTWQWKPTFGPMSSVTCCKELSKGLTLKHLLEKRSTKPYAKLDPLYMCSGAPWTYKLHSVQLSGLLGHSTSLLLRRIRWGTRGWHLGELIKSKDRVRTGSRRLFSIEIVALECRCPKLPLHCGKKPFRVRHIHCETLEKPWRQGVLRKLRAMLCFYFI